MYHRILAYSRIRDCSEGVNLRLVVVKVINLMNQPMQLIGIIRDNLGMMRNSGGSLNGTLVSQIGR